MRGFSLSFLLVAWMSCTACCCGGIPTFGLWPEGDQAAVAAAVEAAPIVVDHLCARGETCSAVEGATVEVVPVAWYPLTDEVAWAVEVQATCRDDQDGGRRIACAGLLGAVGGAGTLYVTENTSFFGPPSGQTFEEWDASTGDVDWD